MPHRETVEQSILKSMAEICCTCKGPLGDNPHKTKCRACYNAYMREYMLKRYHDRRNKFIELKGGECVDCGTNESLEFDHVIPKDKWFTISDSRVWNRPLHIIEKELEKCVLRCHDCHAEKTSREMSVAHGGGKSGKRNCKCLACKAKKAEYMKEYNAKGVVS